MDRRSFLKFLSAAPLAVPMVAASAPAAFATHRLSVGIAGYYGSSVSGTTDWLPTVSQFDSDALTFNRGYLQTVQIADRIARTSELPFHNVLERSVQHALDIVSEPETEPAKPELPVIPVAPPPASEGA